MHKKNLLLFTLIALFFFSACNENRIFKEYQSDFAKNRWSKDNQLVFKPEITDTDLSYNIYVSLRHVYGFQIKNVKFTAEIESPSGEKTSQKTVMQIIDDNAEYLSDCAGDYCDIDALIFDNYTFKEKGIYTVRLSQSAIIDPLLNVLKAGIIIDKIPVEQK